MKFNRYLCSIGMIAAFYLPMSSQTHNQPKAVDLGLSVLWSDTYLDAEMVELANAGYYWASTTPRKNLIQPNEEVPYNVNVGLNIAHSNYDCVTAALGDGWRLPTKAECEELAKLKLTFTSDYEEVCGFTLTADNGNSIFIEYASGDNTIGLKTTFWTADAWRESDLSTDFTKAWACRISITKGVEVIDMTRKDTYLFVRPVKDITPTGVAVTDITLTDTNLTLPVGEQAGLYAAVLPVNASDKRVTFTSSDESVVTVDSKGQLCAVSAGSATVTATATDGSGVSAVCEVTVPSLAQSRDIDLGLSVIWASHNVGAESSQEIGDYYQFANPELLTKWSITTSPYRTSGVIPVLNMAGTEYDPATKVLGKEWMTPTKEQFQELFDNCDFEGFDNGVEFTSKINGNKIFFPNTGFMYVSGLNLSDFGCYMTAEIDKTSLSTAKVTYARLSKGIVPQFTENPQAYKGYPIRAVKQKDSEGETGIDYIIGDDTDATVDVYTLTGVRILTRADSNSLSDLAPGLYILRTSAGKTTKIRL